MLARNLVCSIQTQNFKFMQSMRIKDLLGGMQSNLLLTLDDIFRQNQIIRDEFTKEACKALTIESDEDKLYSPYYGVMLSSVFFVDDMQLCTSSQSILKDIKLSGGIENDAESLSISKIRRNIDTYCFHVNRDFSTIVEKSNIDLSSCSIYPVVAVIEVLNVLSDILKNGVLQIKVGEQILTVTRTPQDSIEFDKVDFRIPILPVYDLDKKQVVDLQIHKITGLSKRR